MKKGLVRILAGVLVVGVLAAASLYFSEGLRARLVAMNLPEFPDWPAPLTSLPADHSGTTYFATHSPFDLDAIFSGIASTTPTTGVGFLTFPLEDTGTERLPAMIILPGSGGISAGRENQYAQLLNDRGIAAFVIDYYAPRGITPKTNYMIKVGTVTEFDLITDAYAALVLLSTHPRIDPKRIGVIGFSYGGMAARLAMDDRLRAALAPEHPGFALHVDTYGPCFQNLQTTKTNGAPLLTLRGTADTSNDLAACAQREQELRDLGVAVTTHIYEGAGHAWENTVPRFLSEESPYLAGCEVRYDADGHASVDGKRVSDYAADATRSERIAARLSSGGKFGNCVGYGYLIGNDDKTKQQGFRDLLAFIEPIFGVADSAPTAYR